MNSYEGEKISMQKEVANLTSKLVDAKSYLCDLEEENVSLYQIENSLKTISEQIKTFICLEQNDQL